MADSKRLRVYMVNADGTNHLIVAAPSKKRASELMGVTLGSLNNYGGAVEPGGTYYPYEMVVSRPGIVFKRKIEVRADATKEWTEVPARKT